MLTQGTARGALHLHAVLNPHAHPRVSAFYHDSAAALVDDGRIVAAAQEERFTRKKHDSGFPRQAVDIAWPSGRLQLEDIDLVVFYDKPFLKFERLLETYLAFAPRGFRVVPHGDPALAPRKAVPEESLPTELRKLAPDFDSKSELLFTEHHLSHAAAAFFPRRSKRPRFYHGRRGEWSDDVARRRRRQ